MLVLPAPLSHQPPSPHPLLRLKRGYHIARGHPELGTGGTRIAQGVLGHNQAAQGCKEPGGKLLLDHHWKQPNREWEDPTGNLPRNRGVPAQVFSDSSLHPCNSCTHALVLVRLVCCLHTLSQQFFPHHPRESTRDRVTSRHVKPWRPGPPPSLCADETTPGWGSGDAVGADNAALGACPAGDTRRFPRAPWAQPGVQRAASYSLAKVWLWQGQPSGPRPGVDPRAQGGWGEPAHPCPAGWQRSRTASEQGPPNPVNTSDPSAGLGSWLPQKIRDASVKPKERNRGSAADCAAL